MKTILMTLSALLALSTAAPSALADGLVQGVDWDLHAQATATEQATAAFASPYKGPNSLDPGNRGRETFDATLYAGYKPWAGGEIWINPELDQGYGLSNTLGLAGFSSAEAYKVGASTPYFKLPRLFGRQTFNLGGETANQDPDLNLLKSSHTENRIVVTVGKFGVPDIFDGGSTAAAHDPRNDFLNWSVVDTGNFDYAADAWGYTWGAAVEAYLGRYTLRSGVFDLSYVPNSKHLGKFGQFQNIEELEERHTLYGQTGVVRLTGFISRANMASFSQVLAGTPVNEIPSPVDFRHYRSRVGVAVSADQNVTSMISLFARAGASDGHYESYDFTDIDRTIAVGATLVGAAWSRPDDKIGLATVDNAISKSHAAYLAAGGLGILVGDGQLSHRGDEHILESYYSYSINTHVRVTADYQLAVNPAYNRDRGPVSIFGLRLHAQL